jgi:hypothetical protein
MASELERFAVAQALYKAIAAQVKTGEPDNLRGRVDDMLRDDYKEKGTDRYRLKVGGVEVGTLSLRLGRAQTRLIVEDETAFLDWLFDDGIGYLHEFINSPKGRALVDFMASAIIADGEVPRGCTAYTEPAHFEGTTVKGCDIEDVANALGLNLPQAMMYALTEGGEE